VVAVELVAVVVVELVAVAEPVGLVAAIDVLHHVPYGRSRPDRPSGRLFDSSDNDAMLSSVMSG
jgi:hypothetical protein